MNNTELVRRDNKVALKQIGNNQRPVPVEYNGTVYQASVQHNVWLAWVEEDSIDFLLTKKVQGCNCGNGAMKPLFKLASVEDVCIFETGDRCK